MEKLLQKLNLQQKNAVLATDGSILIVAGAGSGKTMVLTSKIAYLILNRDIAPENILAVTFTNKAAKEMKERVFKLLAQYSNASVPANESALNIGTFHSIGARILRQHIDLLGYSRNFAIFDEDNQEELIKTIMKEFEIDAKKFPPSLFLAHISKLKSKLTGIKDYDSQSDAGFFKILADVLPAYQKALKDNNAVDFDDMIALCVEIFRNHPEILARYQQKFRYILIDEYQDTNYAQYQLINMLAKSHGNLCVVGDSDQSIYRWRQADIKNILNFEKDYPQSQVFLLEENYRSTQSILDAANQVIKKNKMRKEKNLFTKNEKGGKIKLIMARDEVAEAEFVAKKIMEIKKKTGCSLADFAALYRTNAQSRSLEEALIKNKIPYKMIGGFKFYERKEIKDLLSYLKFIFNPKDKISLKRIISYPPRGIGKVSLEKFIKSESKTPQIESFMEMISALRSEQKNLPLSQFIKLLAKKSGIENHLKNSENKEEIGRWENIMEFISAASRYDQQDPETALETFLEDTALISSGDEESRDGMVNLMTIHSAKGLEFEVVFLIGMEDNLFPHSRSKNSIDELEEERRLCYVAITRAKKEIYLLYAQKRKIYGQTQVNPPSRFIFDLPEHLVEFQEYGIEKWMKELDFEDGIIDIE